MPARKVVNYEGGSDARYDTGEMWDAGDGRMTDGTYYYDGEGRPLDSIPGGEEWTPGLPGARGGSGPGDMGGGGGGGVPNGALIAQGLAFAKKAYEQALAKITNQRQTVARSSGFTFDVDPETGVMRSMRVDPQSLYGGFQMLNRQQAQRDEDARGAAMERGLGSGGGLAAQMRSNARFTSGEEDAKFSSSLTDTISQLALQQQEAKNAYDMAKWQSELDMARSSQPRGGRYPSPSSPSPGPSSPSNPGPPTFWNPNDPDDMILKKPYQVTPLGASTASQPKPVKFNFTRKGGI